MNKIKKTLPILEANFKKGDEAAFKVFFDMYHAKLYSFINSYTNNTSETQDIVQEAFIKLWEVKSTLNEENSISGYLYKIAYNIFIDGYRKHKQETKMLDTLAYKKMNAQEESEVDEDITSNKIKELTKVIDNLPPRCKEIFKMSKIQGYKYKEIAIELDISIKTVEAQMSKAFTILREKLKKNNLFLFFIYKLRRKLSF